MSIAVATLSATLSWIAVAAADIPSDWWRTMVLSVLTPGAAVRLVAVPPVAMSLALLAVLGLIIAAGTRGLARIGLVLGVVLWLGATLLPMSSRTLAITGVPAALTLLAFAPLLADLGRRSRTYRTRPASRQPIGPLESALLVGLASYVFAEVLQQHVGADATIALRLVAVACIGMTVVGFAYLVWNAFWLWRTLSRWQPILGRVIYHDGSESSGEAEQPPPA